MITQFGENWSDKDKAELLDLLFIINSLNHGNVSFESNGFMLDCPAYHTHIHTFENPSSVIENTKNFIINLDEYNKKNLETTTHEELKEKGLSSIDWATRPRNGKSSRLLSKTQLLEEQNIINKIKKDLKEN